MISRRRFIESSAALTAVSVTPLSKLLAGENEGYSNKSIRNILPRRLQKGDTIGLVTPGGPITEEQLKNTASKLKEFGFKTYYLPSVLSQYGYFAGTDTERADELMHMFANDKVDAILCVRGGYGAIRILDMLDYELIKQHPKALIGYSDITALLSVIFERTGLVTFHGPVGVSSFNNFTMEAFENVLMKSQGKYKYSYEREAETEENPEYDLYAISEGKAEGILIGGNLSVLDSMIGSKFEPDFENKIVYLEETDEKIYRIDKMLFHLLYATNLKKAAGIALGIFNGCDYNEEEPSLTLKQAITDLLKPLGIPVVYGLPFGHISSKITLPTGVKARLNAGKKTLKLLDKAVS
ncbi:S66 peptidase family protein [Maribellus sediminis]|uniref:S66 peptidase family protein n=1 Tax=Maribellus sediminis TaxID=2696285 RepID=UPI0014304F50|nr:LD-carboxypeptidase [Maribellus sediminis]